jgi:hypothetical protein
MRTFIMSKSCKHVPGALTKSDAELEVAKHKTEQAPKTKPVPVHPLVAESFKIRDEIAELTKKHKESVAAIRARVSAFYAKVSAADLSDSSLAGVQGNLEEVASTLNMLDPDCSVTSVH